jgi:hypothetical protein
MHQWANHLTVAQGFLDLVGQQVALTGSLEVLRTEAADRLGLVVAELQALQDKGLLETSSGADPTL